MEMKMETPGVCGKFKVTAIYERYESLILIFIGVFGIERVVSDIISEICNRQKVNFQSKRLILMPILQYLLKEFSLSYLQGSFKINFQINHF